MYCTSLLSRIIDLSFFCDSKLSNILRESHHSDGKETSSSPSFFSVLLQLCFPGMIPPNLKLLFPRVVWEISSEITCLSNFSFKDPLSSVKCRTMICFNGIWLERSISHNVSCKQVMLEKLPCLQGLHSTEKKDKSGSMESIFGVLNIHETKRFQFRCTIAYLPSSKSS